MAMDYQANQFWYDEEILRLSGVSNEKKRKNEESKLKIHKEQLGFNEGYSSWKPVKGGLGKGRKLQRAIQSMKSSH